MNHAAIQAVARLLQLPYGLIQQAAAHITATNTTAFSVALAQRLQCLNAWPGIRAIIHQHTPEA